MRIAIGSTPYATHYIHTERLPWNRVADPANPGQKMDVIDFLAYCAKNPAARTAAGYDHPTGDPADPPGTTRWHRIQAAGGAAGADPALVAALAGAAPAATPAPAPAPASQPTVQTVAYTPAALPIHKRAVAKVKQWFA